MPVENSPPRGWTEAGAKSCRRRYRDLLRSKEAQDIGELKRQGLSVQAISNVMGIDRKTVRKYLRQPGVVPAYGPRPALPGKLDPFKP